MLIPGDAATGSGQGRAAAWEDVKLTTLLCLLCYVGKRRSVWPDIDTLTSRDAPHAAWSCH